MVAWLFINELEGVWKEDVVVKFEVLSQHLPIGTKEKHEKRLSDSLSPDRDTNRGLAE